MTKCSKQRANRHRAPDRELAAFFLFFAGKIPALVAKHFHGNKVKLKEEISENRSNH